MNKRATEFLIGARTLHFQWLRLKARHDALESCLLPAAIRYDKDKVQTSTEDPMSKIVAEVVALEEEMKRVQFSKAEQISKIGKVINDLESEEEKTALTMRYVNFLPVTKIAKEMRYSEKRIYQFMDRGGAEISKRLETLENQM